MNLTDYLFNTPWWLPTTIAVVGAVLAYSANKRQETRLRATGLAVILLAVLLGVVSYFVDTDLEKAVKQTRQLVNAFEEKDWDAFRAGLHPNTSLGVLNGLTLYRGRDMIATKAREASDRYGFRAVNITSLKSRQDQTLITVTIGIVSTQDITAMRPVTSTWEFDYLEAADGWYLNEVRAVEIGRQQGQGMQSMFPLR
jgi:HAMP domain-containing protein